MSTMKLNNQSVTRAIVAYLLLGTIAAASRSQENAVGQPGESTTQQAIERGLNYLREHGQAEDGTFSIEAGPGLTALAITAALRNGLPVGDPMVAKGLKALEGFVKPDGGIYGNGRLKNYETCVAIVAFQLANKDGRYKELLANADKFVRGLQIGADGAVESSDPSYGGASYGGPGRPDLSNTAYLIDALVAGGAEPSDPAIQRALAFVSRCQNLKGPHNDTKFAALVNDGGFYYVIPSENEDPSTSERYDENGGLRSYGSMTYSGFKSLVYAGLTQDDPRAKAAKEWIQKNYTVEKNPGQGDAGLYYYYHAFAAALKASTLNTITDDAGQSHNWRKDLAAELVERQRPDGSWTNSNRQWFENDANLATSFALIALSYCEAQPVQP
jgi:squalene-hopene/tetraprenyl-beta-curcumene cyclase